MNTSTDSSLPRARFQRAERCQIEMRMASLDQLVPRDHRVRAVWAYVEALDLGPLYAKIRAVEGHVGRNPVDPRILMALWMFATIEAVSSARHLERLCERDIVYQWLCGGVGVNYHLLSDFRTAHGEFLDQLLTDTIATLLHQGVIELDVVAQDGMRVRASAGAGSFRREKTLRECQREARDQVEKLREECEDRSSGDASNARRKSARERAARERAKRVEQALEELAELQQQKEQREEGSGENVRCSTTDPEARRMKMANGGYRPAYNVQFATDGQARVIVSADVVNAGNDNGQMAPLYENVCERSGRTPQQYLVDAGFASKADITTVEQNGTAVLGPIYRADQMRSRGNDPHARQRRDTDEMFAFRQRMATDEAQALYKQRGSIAEFPNAACRNRGLQQFRVRGLQKVRTVTLWYVITFNFLRMLKLNCLPAPG